MHSKKWIKVFLIIILTVTSLLSFLNFVIDPLWTFNHSNKFNNAQPGFNERQQKINRAYSGGLEQYDSLLLGSSRSTYINQYDFANMKVFNFASANMYPYEYNGWIDIAKKIKGKDFKTIIIGMDFYGSSNGILYKEAIKGNKLPIAYFKATIKPFYKYKQLMSAMTFRKSITSLIHYWSPGTDDYSRDNIKSTILVSDNRKRRASNTQFKQYSTKVYGEAYNYNNSIEYHFEQLKRNNPNTKFIIFTTPISKDFFELLVKKGNLSDYLKWLKVLVEEFGEVYNFMGINTITSNKSNYPDLHHFYPFIGTLIANKISKKDNKNIPNDFAILLTKENINNYLEKIKETK